MKAAGTAFAVVALLALAAPSPGQSLAEAARREKERRSKPDKPPARSFGDEDLAARRGEAPASSASPSPSPSPSASPSTAAARRGEDEAAARRRLEAEWRVRFANARANVANAEANGWYDTVETVFVSGIPVQQRVRKFQETDELRQARQALADLEEEFRRTGLPPGWTRD
jgi:hypothetical protein